METINWFNFIQSTGIIITLLFTAYTVHKNTKTRKVTNLFIITQAHREIWSRMFNNPNLNRINDTSITLDNISVTEDERLFISMLLLHLNCTFQALKTKTIMPIEGLNKDIKNFLELPIPNQIWVENKKYLDKKFIKFVEENLQS